MLHTSKGRGGNPWNMLYVFKGQKEKIQETCNIHPNEYFMCNILRTYSFEVGKYMFHVWFERWV